MFYLKHITFFLLTVSGILHAQTVNLHLWATGEDHNRAVKTVSLLDNYTVVENGDDVFNRYGSDSRIKTTATGFFYTKKIDGRWWIIDPDGYAGINMSVTSLPDLDADKADQAYSILRKNGFNGTGNFLKKENMTKTQYNDRYAEKMTYTRRKNFFQNYRIERQKTYTTPTAVKNNPQNYITIFDPEFESFVDNFASTFANYKNERDLLGYFSDNEINFTENQLKLFLTVLPTTDPNYQAAMNFITEKGYTKEQVIANYDNLPELRNTFLKRIMNRYYSLVTSAIKKYDPNHLYLGTRLHGKSRDSETCVSIAADWCDIISVNYYNYVFPSDQICSPTKWTKWLENKDKPCMITEFYAKAYNSTYPEQSGAGFYTDDQAGRGIFYQSSCLDVLRSKYYVGWHYFRWQDDPAPDFSNKGIVNSNNQEYTDMTYYMEELNRQVYQLIDYMDNKTCTDDTESFIITASQDTWLQLSGSDSQDIHGNSPELSTARGSVDAGLREIMLKFDLENLYKYRDQIQDAYIELHFLRGNNIQQLSVTGLKNRSWNENELNGFSALITPSLRSNYGKGRTKSFANLQTNMPIRLNVRNWIINEADNSELIFRIVPEKSSEQAAWWASKEHQNELLHPVLVLKFNKGVVNAIPTYKTNPIRAIVDRNMLSISGISQITDVGIWSVTGQAVKSLMIRPMEAVPLNMRAGIYLINMIVDNQVITQKIKTE